MVKTVRQNTPVFSVFKGLLFSYIITAFILLLLSLLMLKLELPAIAISIGINVAYIASTFVGGILTGKKMGQKRFLWGLILGIAYFIILMLASLMLNGTSTLPLANLFVVFAMCSISGMLGGMLS
ncbi:MAG: TIGR04086 family membrane protein [Herbinix sp.]|nr:TIGR04086 family membrane protein [Herbinix sp.]